MVKLRRNHQKAPAGSYLTRPLLFGLVFLLLVAAAKYFGKGLRNGGSHKIIIEAPKGTTSRPEVPLKDQLLPTTKDGYIVAHRYFTLSYVEKHEQPEWVTYFISRKRLNGHHVKRTNWFEKDPKVHTGSATYYDYKGSGYDRGHLAPAGDMSFSQEAMEECFLMSNMSPQQHNFNGGIWRELEENARDWARKERKLYVVSGPVFKDNLGQIGRRNKITIPGYYYKILLDLEGPEKKAIGFVIPNKVSYKPLRAYVHTIDEIEALTGIDFFPELEDSLEAKLESEVSIRKWQFDKNLERTRIEQWNKR